MARAGFALANKRWIGAANLMTNRSRHYYVQAFEEMVDDLNAQGIEHVLCTGDVTNLGLEQEFLFARERFDRLANGPTGVTVIPGNHDAYVAAGIAHFATTFGDYNTTDPGWEWTDATDADAHWPIVRVRGELALIGVTTSRATPWFTAYGRVGDDQLARLRTALSRSGGSPAKVRVVADPSPAGGQRSAPRAGSAGSAITPRSPRCSPRPAPS